VARRHGLNRNQLFAWRRQFHDDELGGSPPAVAGFVPVAVGESATAAGPTGGPPDGSRWAKAIEIVVGEVTLRVPPSSDEAHLRWVLAVVVNSETRD
jgi:transposase-like protein